MKKVIMCLISVVLSVPTVWGQISPGELTKAHANLEGIRNCVKCHELGDKVTNEKCLACHTKIATRIQQHEGYHASSEVQGKDCSTCHNEHHGRDFDMLNLDKATFNHNLTGFQLQGAHKRTDCQACHQKKFITDTKLKDKKLTYLGLSQHASLATRTITGKPCRTIVPNVTISKVSKQYRTSIITRPTLP